MGTAELFVRSFYPNYPDGIAVDASRGKPVSCKVEIPYPAPECGSYVVSCKVCGLTAVITAAGRPDDPISVKLACDVNSVSVAHA